MAKRKKRYKYTKQEFINICCNKCGICDKGTSPDLCYSELYVMQPKKFIKVVFKNLLEIKKLANEKGYVYLYTTDKGMEYLEYLFRRAFCSANLCGRYNSNIQCDNIIGCIAAFRRQVKGYASVDVQSIVKGHLNNDFLKNSNKNRAKKKKRYVAQAYPTFFTNDNSVFLEEINTQLYIMEITIKNKIKLENSPIDLNTFLIQELQVLNPKFLEAQKLGYSIYGIDEYINNFSFDLHDNLLIPRGYRRKLLALLKDMKLDYTLKDERTKLPYIDINSSKIMYRTYQTKAVVDLVHEDEGMLVAPAGSGKTVMGLSLIPFLGQPTLWITHTGPLLAQTMAMANKFLPSIDVGFIEDGKWEIGKILTIGMVQTLIKDPKKLVEIRNSFGLVIQDEVHHCPAKTFSDVISQLNPYYLYGLTATPYRRDKLENIMFQTIGPIESRIPIKEVIDSGGIILPTIKYKTIHSKRVDTNNIQMILKDHIVNNISRNRMIVSDVLEEAVNNNFCIVISDRKAHCEMLYNLISVGWENTGIATGKYSKKYVQEQVDRFNKKEITVLVTTSQLLGEGFDVPFINRAFITMPFRAEAKAEQIVGRVQRTHFGKENAIVYDYVDADIGVLANQFYSRTGSCRHKAYTRLGLTVEPY